MPPMQSQLHVDVHVPRIGCRDVMDGPSHRGTPVPNSLLVAFVQRL